MPSGVYKRTEEHKNNMKGARGFLKKRVGYHYCHAWLSIHYGKPRICEGTSCNGKTENMIFDWALKKGRTCLRKKENFLRLCRSCHRKYDGVIPPSRKGILHTKKTKEKMSESRMGNINGQGNKGKKKSKEHRKNLSIAKSNYYKQLKQN